MPIRDYSQTAASNTSISSINIGEGCPPSNINDAIRQALADIRELQAGSTIASAATVNIGAANAEYLAVSGTTTITAFDSVAAGVYRVLKFDGALTLTHNATSLILPGGASITTAAGDVAGFRSLGSGNWRCEWFSKADGSPISLADASVTSAKIGSSVTISFANGTAGAPSITTTGDTNTGIYFPAANTLAASTAGSDRMRIDSAGNVGIGTTSPAYKLDVNGAIRMPNATAILMNDSSGVAKQTLQLFSDDNTYMSTPGALILRTNGTTERMRIDSAGRVGIATSTPSTNATLTVNGNIAVAIPTRNAASANQIGVWTSDDPVDNARAAISFATVAGGSSSNSYIAFATNNYGVSGGERMRIDSSGNVGIGTTSPGQKLTVAGTIESTSGGVKFPDGTTQTTAAAGGSGVPAGSVMDYAGATAPSGWLLCAGQAVSRSTYAALFTAISTTYGAGDGSTTFNLPDLRGRVAVGKDDMNGTAANRITSGGSGITGTTLGAAGGTQTHTLTTAQMPAHTHGGVLTPTGGSSTLLSCGSSTSGDTGSTGGGGAHQNTQPSMILNKIIKT